MTATTSRALLCVLMAVLIVIVGLAAPVAAADGDLDPTFDTDGKVITDFLIPVTPDLSVSGIDGATAIALQADGKIVTAGFTTVADTFDLILAFVRYNPDGSLDPTFGTGGRH